MKVLPFNCDDAAIKALVIEWSDFLSQEKYQEAIDLLHPSYWDPRNKELWSPDLLENHIRYRGSIVPVPFDEGVSHVTPYHDAVVPDSYRETWAERHLEVDRKELWGQDKSKYDGIVHYDLPLDGYWSDLTARFEIRIVPGGIALELVDIHTL